MHVMGDFVFCFDYISTWHCISNQRLVPCNRWTLQDTPNWDTISPQGKLSPRPSHVGPISPHWNGSRPTQSCLQYVTLHQETESDGSRTTFEEVTQAKVRMNVHQRWALFLAGRGVLRSDTLCYFVAPCLPMQFLGDNWEDTTHSYIHNRHKQATRARTHTQSITRKQQTHDMGTRIELE